MNIATNPWSFTSSDVLTATVAASPTGMSVNSDNVTVTMTTTTAHGFLAGQYVTTIGNGVAWANGFWFVLQVPTTTTAILQPAGNQIVAGQAATGGGFVMLNQYSSAIRMEDMSWQNAPSGSTLTIYDRNGNLIWYATVPGPANYTTAPYINYNRGKTFWVSGLSLFAVPSPSYLLITVN